MQAMGVKKYKDGFEPSFHPEALQEPFRIRKPTRIFVCSMADLFHEAYTLERIHHVWDTMKHTPHHTYYVLTKRTGRLWALRNRLEWLPNIMVGTTVESDCQIVRLQALHEVPAAKRFVSFEPLLGPVGVIPMEGLDWVIVGGESGPGARLMALPWVRDIRDQCIEAKVPFFFKGWGRTNDKTGKRLLDGREWNELPGHSYHASFRLSTPPPFKAFLSWDYEAG
jgi:protein gp37